MDNQYNTPFAKGKLQTILAYASSSGKNHPDLEHEQAVIRLLVGSVASIYILFSIWSDNGTTKYVTIAGIILFFFIASAILVSIINNPGTNIPRRIFGSILDNSSATALLLLNGSLVAPIFIVYLWVSFGNGFRFGRRYLLFSTTLSVIGFSSVLFLSHKWSLGYPVSIGLLIGLVVLPLYVASLLSRLEKALVKAEAANRAKSNFLATMSHEIRTPLNGLIGILNLLDMSDLKAKQQYYVDLMKNSSDWLLNVISDGLDFTKIEADELVVSPVPTDVKTTILAICEVHGEVAKRKGIALEKDVTGLSISNVSCDPNRLAQVLNNLLSNGCKFTEKGIVKLVATSSELPDDMVRLTFGVSDTGVGITADNLESIFLPFKQISPESSDVFGGSGLGLAISSRLIKLMGGEIQVESRLGVGTTFSFYLDVPVVQEIEIQKQGTQQNGFKWSRKPLILLVEDNKTNQEVAIAYLKQLGCEVLTAMDGFEAVALVQKNIFDLIFMDCQMPLMDGYEATRKIRSIEPDYSKNIIIALTAHITNKDKETCFEVGMNDYMGKPYTIETLQFFLSKWLESLQVLEVTASEDKFLPLRDELENNNIPQSSKAVHDLRNALAGVIGGVELAIISQKDPLKCERHLQTALKGAKQAVSVSKKLT